MSNRVTSVDQFRMGMLTRIVGRRFLFSYITLLIALASCLGVHNRRVRLFRNAVEQVAERGGDVVILETRKKVAPYDDWELQLSAHRDIGVFLGRRAWHKSSVIGGRTVLRGPEAVAIDENLLRAIAQLQSLSVLDLSHTTLSSRALNGLIESNSIETLFLDDTNITIDGLRAIAQVRSLRFVSLETTDISDVDVRRLMKSRPELVIHR